MRREQFVLKIDLLMSSVCWYLIAILNFPECSKKKMLWRKTVTIALLLLVSACIAEKLDDSMEEIDDDSFYDSRGEFKSIEMFVSS